MKCWKYSAWDSACVQVLLVIDQWTYLQMLGMSRMVWWLLKILYVVSRKGIKKGSSIPLHVEIRWLKSVEYGGHIMGVFGVLLSLFMEKVWWNIIIYGPNGQNDSCAWYQPVWCGGLVIMLQSRSCFWRTWAQFVMLPLCVVLTPGLFSKWSRICCSVWVVQTTAMF